MSTADVQAQITAIASASGVPPNIALAVAQQESSFNQAAHGTSGEIGVFQLMPGTAASLGVNPNDLTQNIQGGVNYLSQMYSRFGNWPTALAAYNAGPGNVSRGVIPASTQTYVANILANAGDVSVADYSTIDPSQVLSADSGIDISQSDLAGTLAGDSMYVALAVGALGLLIWWVVSNR